MNTNIAHLFIIAACKAFVCTILVVVVIGFLVMLIKTKRGKRR